MHYIFYNAKFPAPLTEELNKPHLPETPVTPIDTSTLEDISLHDEDEEEGQGDHRKKPAVSKMSLLAR